MYREKEYNRENEIKEKKRPVYQKPAQPAPHRKSVRGNFAFDEETPRRKKVAVHREPEYFEEPYEIPERPRRRRTAFVADRQPDDVYDNPRSKISFVPKKEKVSKPRKKKKGCLFVIILCLILAAGWFYLAGGLNSHPLTHNKSELGISHAGKFGVTNIAFFGVDTRDDTDTGRSDAMIVLTVDVIRGDMKMTSLLRDSRVPIEGHGETKLNHAYAYGGPELAVKTINQAFELDVKDFVTVNFNQLAEIVDAVGGVTIDVTEAERGQINHLIDEQFPGSAHLENSGSVVLNGVQAISYSRIRYIDSDNARTDRQQEVLNGIFGSVKDMSILEYPRFIHRFSSIAENSISFFDLLKVSPIMLRNYEVERYTIPDAEYETDLTGGIDSDGMWCWHYDRSRAVERLHSIVYGE